MTRASLPMYDWPEVRPQTDAFWTALRNDLTARGIDAPAELDRATPRYDLWRAPDLVLSQTCGWPLVSKLSSHVDVVAIPTYAVDGCGNGTYRSALIAREPGDALALARSRVAVNSFDSLSGYWTFANTLAKGGLKAGHVGAWVETGSHRNSVIAVAQGRADVAAIDAVSWQLALDHDAEAKTLTVIGWTDELPALPFVTAKTSEVAMGTLRASMKKALSSSPQPYLTGLSAGSLTDYSVVAPMGETARAAGF